MEQFNIGSINKGTVLILGALILLFVIIVILSSCRMIRNYLKGRFSESKSQITEYYNDTVDEIVQLEEMIADFVETHDEQITDSFYREIKQTFDRLEQKIGNAMQAVEKMNKQFIAFLFDKFSEEALSQIETMRSSQSRLWSIWSQLLKNEDEAEYQKRQESYASHATPRKRQDDYFAGCSNKREIRKKYRFLVKQFHPDNGGSPEEFMKIEEQYQKALRGGIL